MAGLSVVETEQTAGSAGAGLRVENVTHVFETGAESLMALKGVSLDVEAETFYGIVGPSGCGKSSLLLMMAGLLLPSEGRIAVGDKTVSKPLPEEIGVVFQESSLLPWKTARENVEFPLYLRGIDRRVRERAALEMLELVGLGEFANHRPHELSGGMKQRVAIARGFCQDPDILLMDEPFAALDEQTRMTLGDELLHLWDRNKKTVVFVTHSLTEAVYLCDKVAVMSARPGEILEIVDIDLPRPRTYDMMATEKFGRLRARIWELIRRTQQR